MSGLSPVAARNARVKVRTSCLRLDREFADAEISPGQLSIISMIRARRCPASGLANRSCAAAV